MRLGDAGRLRNGNLQLLFRGRQMQHEEGHIEHSLVAALQILQEIFRRAAVGGEVGGENIQIVAAACSLLLLLNLHASRSVILRLTILIASFWLMPRMCMVTRRFPSTSMKSVRMRS